MPAILAALLAFLLPTHLPPIIMVAQAQTIPAQMPIAPTITEMVVTAAKAAGVSTSTAVAIAGCESGLRQYDDSGNLLHGVVDPGDLGVFQIHDSFHEADARARGMDIRTLSGNIDYGIFMLKTEGTAPWLASKYCWAPLIHNK